MHHDNEMNTLLSAHTGACNLHRLRRGPRCTCQKLFKKQPGSVHSKDATHHQQSRSPSTHIRPPPSLPPRLS